MTRSSLTRFEVAPVPPDPPPPAVSWADIGGLLGSMADNIASLLAVLGFIWFVFKPRVVEFVQSVKTAQEKAGKAEQHAEAVHHQLTTNGGKSPTPTVLDRLHKIELSQLERTSIQERQAAVLEQLAETQEVVLRMIDQLHADAEERNRQGAAYVEVVRPLLAEKGINVPPLPSAGQN